MPWRQNIVTRSGYSLMMLFIEYSVRGLAIYIRKKRRNLLEMVKRPTTCAYHSVNLVPRSLGDIRLKRYAELSSRTLQMLFGQINKQMSRTSCHKITLSYSICVIIESRSSTVRKRQNRSCARASYRSCAFLSAYIGIEEANFGITSILGMYLIYLSI